MRIVAALLVFLLLFSLSALMTVLDLWPTESRRAIGTSKEEDAMGRVNDKVPDADEHDDEFPNADSLLVVQFGPPRTASTFQFEILCLSMFEKLLELNNTVALDRFKCRFTSDGKAIKAPFVGKSHTPRSILETLEPSKVPEGLNVWFFESTLTNTTSTAERVKYVQPRDKVSKDGIAVLRDYQRIFQLSDCQLDSISEFMRYWEILRRCCGCQMSADWREAMLPAGKKNANFRSKNDLHSSAYPACEMYDISAVERLFLQTTIARQMAKFPNLRDMLKPSTVDETLDGTYCSRYNSMVSTKAAQFNEILH